MIYIGLDDTDQVGTPGTGHLAREVAAWLEADFSIFGITRHQLLVHPDIPFTAKNSTNVLAIEDVDMDLGALLDHVAGFMLPRCAEGSDPAICVARDKQVADLSHGKRCQTEVVTVAAAEETAAVRSIHLKSLAGSPCGMIGALAGVCLAAEGNDGRFIRVGTVRDLRGRLPVSHILSAGVASIRTKEGDEITEGIIDTGDKLRPSVRDNQAVQFVSPMEPGIWQAIRY